MRDFNEKAFQPISQTFKELRCHFDVMVLLKLQELSLGWKCLISTRLSQFRCTFLNILNCSFLKYQVFLSVHPTSKSTYNCTYLTLKIIITEMETTFRYLFRHTHLLKFFTLKKKQFDYILLFVWLTFSNEVSELHLINTIDVHFVTVETGGKCHSWQELF